MAFKLNQLNTKEELLAFLLNPFEIACYYGGKILQKYQVNDHVDELFMFETRYSSYSKGASINYEKQEIYILKDYEFRAGEIGAKPFVKISEQRSLFKDAVIGTLPEMEKMHKSKIEKCEEFDTFYNEMYNQYFQQLVNHFLGANQCYMRTYNKIDKSLTEQIDKLTFEDIISFREGERKKVEEIANQLVFSSNYIKALAIEKLIQQVSDYVNANKFTAEEIFLKSFIEKCKACGAERFTVSTIYGEKKMCRNEIDAKGKIHPTSGKGALALNEIAEITYKGKIVYKRGGCEC